MIEGLETTKGFIERMQAESEGEPSPSEVRASAIDRAEEEDATARAVVELARDELLSSAAFVAPALGKLELRPGVLDEPLASDATSLFFDAGKLLDRFLETKTVPTEALLHTLLHCLYLHPFANGDVDTRLWNLACDLAVAHVQGQVSPLDGNRAELLRELRTEVGAPFTAERIYQAFRNGDFNDSLERLEDLFRVDDHTAWGIGDAPKEDDDTDTPPDDSQNPDDSQDENDGSEYGGKDETASAQTGERDRNREEAQDGHDEAPERAGERERAAQDWASMSEELGIDPQSDELPDSGNSFDPEQGGPALERVEYRELLRRFAAMGETQRLSDDEFDTNFYSWGLHEYGNLAFIEALESREERRIREFAIAIDTSGSVAGQPISSFVKTSYNILSDADSFFEKTNIHVILCDEAVQEDYHITCPSDLDIWVRNMTLIGWGGTDFRPVFEYVDELIEKGELPHFGGLIYFTDGQGAYPEKVPAYPVAFVYYEEGEGSRLAPPWAIQAVIVHDE